MNSLSLPLVLGLVAPHTSSHSSSLSLHNSWFVREADFRLPRGVFRCFEGCQSPALMSDITQTKWKSAWKAAQTWKWRKEKQKTRFVSPPLNGVRTDVERIEKLANVENENSARFHGKCRNDIKSSNSPFESCLKSVLVSATRALFSCWLNEKIDKFSQYFRSSFSDFHALDRRHLNEIWLTTGLATLWRINRGLTLLRIALIA